MVSYCKKRTVVGRNTEDTCHLGDGNLGLFFPGESVF